MRVQTTGKNFEIDDELQKYIDKKLGGLERFLPRKARESAHLEVRVKQAKKEQSCEAVLTLPRDTFVVEETTMNAYAAIDIIEDTMKTHIAKYKRLYAGGRLYHRLKARLERL